jgi:choline-sulfatase
VLDSQRARRLVDRALRNGRYTPWDHVPLPDSANEYMRNHLDLRDVEAGRRFPRAPAPVGRWPLPPTPPRISVICIRLLV